MTITGTAVDPGGVPIVGRLAFKPIASPVRGSTALTFTKIIYATTNEDGEFSLTLLPGRYSLDHRFGSVPENQNAPLIIRVSNEVGPNDYQDLIESSVSDADSFGGSPVARSSFRFYDSDGTLWERTWIRQGPEGNQAIDVIITDALA